MAGAYAHKTSEVILRIGWTQNWCYHVVTTFWLLPVLMCLVFYFELLVSWCALCANFADFTVPWHMHKINFLTSSSNDYKSLMHALRNYTQIQHSLVLVSACHSPTLCPPVPDPWFSLGWGTLSGSAYGNISRFLWARWVIWLLIFFKNIWFYVCVCVSDCKHEWASHVCVLSPDARKNVGNP